MYYTDYTFPYVHFADHSMILKGVYGYTFHLREISVSL